MRLGDLLHLVPLLEEADPNDIIIINSDSTSVLLISQRPGLHQPVMGPLDMELTASDEAFLRALRIPT